MTLRWNRVNVPGCNRRGSSGFHAIQVLNKAVDWAEGLLQ